MTDGPKRFESELTVVIDRSKLPPKPAPLSTIPGPTIEQLADIERARRDLEDAVDTMVPCPGPCSACPCCHGVHMVSPERAAVWRRARGSEPPPEAA